MVPMPRFVGNSVGVSSGVGEVEAEFRGMGHEPPEGPGSAESRGQFGATGATHVDRAAGVVFAASGCGEDAEGGSDLSPAPELGAKQGGLFCDAAEAGDGEKLDAVRTGRVVHFSPGGSGARGQADGASGRAASDADEPSSLPLQWHIAGARIIGGNAQAKPKPAELDPFAGARSHGEGMAVAERAAPQCPASCSASQRSASMAAWQPMPAAVTAWRYT